MWGFRINIPNSRCPAALQFDLSLFMLSLIKRNELMKIAVVGAGGVGGYFGARLAQGGCDVGFVARGAHLAALREHGLRVESQLGEIHLPKVRVSDDPIALGPADYVFICVKLWDTETAV